MVNLSAVLRVVRPNEFFLVFHVQCCRSCIHVHTILIFAILFLLKTLWKQFHFSLKIWLHTLYGMDRVHIIQLTSIVLLTKKWQLFSENIKKTTFSTLGRREQKNAAKSSATTKWTHWLCLENWRRDENDMVTVAIAHWNTNRQVNKVETRTSISTTAAQNNHTQTINNCNKM